MRIVMSGGGLTGSTDLGWDIEYGRGKILALASVGRFTEAKRFAKELVAGAEHTTVPGSTPPLCSNLAAIAYRHGDVERAARLFGYVLRSGEGSEPSSPIVRLYEPKVREGPRGRGVRTPPCGWSRYGPAGGHRVRDRGDRSMSAQSNTARHGERAAKRELPTGTVTFLFTDVGRSTQTVAELFAAAGCGTVGDGDRGTCRTRLVDANAEIAAARKACATPLRPGVGLERKTQCRRRLRGRDAGPAVLVTVRSPDGTG